MPRARRIAAHLTVVRVVRAEVDLPRLRPDGVVDRLAVVRRALGEEQVRNASVRQVKVPQSRGGLGIRIEIDWTFFSFICLSIAVAFILTLFWFPGVAPIQSLKTVLLEYAPLP